MSRRKQFAVIGLGRFGSSVCRTLQQLGHEVLAIDESADMVRMAQGDGIGTHVVQADTADIHALEELAITNYDAVIVAIGADLEASVLTVLNLMDLGVGTVVAKAAHEKHGKVLARIGGGAIKVVQPEAEMGARVARTLAGGEILETIELDPEYAIAEIVAPAFLVGKSLMEADLRARYQVTVLAIKSHGELNIAPLATDRINVNDILALLGPKDRLKELQP